MADPITAVATDQSQQLGQAQAEVQAQIEAGGSPTQVTLPTGKVVSADSPEALTHKLAQMKADGDQHISRIEAENKQLREKLLSVEATQQRLAQAFNPQGTSEEQFSQERYLQLLAQDARQAQSYALKFTPEWKAINERAEQWQYRDVGMAFMAEHPEFTQSEKDVNAIIEYCNSQGLDPSKVEHLNAAYARLGQTGKLTSSAPQGSRPVKTVLPPYVPGTSAAPVQGNAAAARTIWDAPNEAEARRLATEQMATGR